MNDGDRVFHQQLGWGIVQRIVQKGVKEGAWVDFGYTKEFLRTEELHTDLKTKAASYNDQVEIKLKCIDNTETVVAQEVRLIAEGIDSAKSPHPIDSTSISEQINARRGLMALRLGQVIESQVFQLSVGTDQLKATLKNQIDKAIQLKPAFILLEGAWGGGKTHAMMLLQAMAREANFCASSMVMDGVALSLSEPMQMMEDALSSIVFHKDSGLQNLGDLMRMVVKKGKIPVLRTKGAKDIADLLSKIPIDAFDDSEALGHIQDYFSLSLSASQAKSKLKLLGYSAPGLPTIRVLRVDDRSHAFCALIRNWSNVLSSVGSRGLLLIIDELDVEYAATAYKDHASAQKRERRRQFLQELHGVAGQRAPLIIAFASAPASSDLDPENDAVEDILNIFGEDIIHLKVPVPKEEDLRVLFANLNHLYNIAYYGANSHPIEDRLGKIINILLERHRRQANPIPRQFVRSVIETFDLISGCERPLDEVIELMELNK